MFKKPPKNVLFLKTTFFDGFFWLNSINFRNFQNFIEFYLFRQYNQVENYI